MFIDMTYFPFTPDSTGIDGEVSVRLPMGVSPPDIVTVNDLDGRKVKYQKSGFTYRDGDFVGHSYWEVSETTKVSGPTYNLMIKTVSVERLICADWGAEQ